MTTDLAALTAAVGSGLSDVRACLLVSRDGLPLAAHPPKEESRALSVWSRVMALGEFERGFAVVGDEVWAFARRGRYGGLAVGISGARPTLLLERLDRMLLAAGRSNLRKDGGRTPAPSRDGSAAEPTKRFRLALGREPRRGQREAKASEEARPAPTTPIVQEGMRKPRLRARIPTRASSPTSEPGRASPTGKPDPDPGDDALATAAAAAVDDLELEAAELQDDGRPADDPSNDLREERAPGKRPDGDEPETAPEEDVDVTVTVLDDASPEVILQEGEVAEEVRAEEEAKDVLDLPLPAIDAPIEGEGEEGDAPEAIEDDVEAEHDDLEHWTLPEELPEELHEADPEAVTEALTEADPEAVTEAEQEVEPDLGSDPKPALETGPFDESPGPASNGRGSHEPASVGEGSPTEADGDEDEVSGSSWDDVDAVALAREFAALMDEGTE